MAEIALDGVWPEWEIIRKIGSGSYGVVYEAKKKDILETYSAIKVITIPQSESELESLWAEGLTEEASRTFMENVKDDFVREIQLMYDFKGTQNIVSIEDYKVVEKKDAIGWIIYIRMELLTPFTQFIRGRDMTEREIVKFGKDICTALELCEKNNVIHRDIKPENIFVNKHGDFKLGDFGIARKLENITGGLSQKGALNYMAPEVARGTIYDNTVDIYSLGIVLYQMCNRNCLPFLSPETQQIPDARAEAVKLRLSGTPLPAPAQASPVMWELIQCACDPIPQKRFISASALKKALESVDSQTYLYRGRVVPPEPPHPPRPPKPAKGLKIVVFILSVILLAIIIVLIMTAVMDKQMNNDSARSDDTKADQMFVVEDDSLTGSKNRCDNRGEYLCNRILIKQLAL